MSKKLEFNYSLIIPVDSEYYDLEFIKNLKRLFSKANIHIGIMGKNPEVITRELPEGICFVEQIPSPDFNYSYCVNRVLRRMVEEDYDLREVIGISENNVLFNLSQLGKISKTIDYKKQFAFIPVYYDYADDTRERISISNIKVSSSVALRAKSIQEVSKTNSELEFIGIPFTTLEQLTVNENGLEERFFTSLSRKHLVNQLEKYGMSKVILETPGLFIEESESNFSYSYTKMDNEILEKINSSREGIVHIQSNLGRELGDPYRIKNLLIQNSIPKWSDDQVTRMVFEDSNDMENVKNPMYSEINNAPLKNKLKKKSALKNHFPSKFILDNLNKKDVLLIVDNKLSSVVSASPLIKRLFTYFGKIDIFTDNTVFPYINMLGKIFTNSVYTPANIQNRTLYPEKYDFVVRTSGSKAILSGNLQKYFECKGDKSDIENNLDIMSSFKDLVEFDEETDSPLPYISYKSGSFNLPDNLVCIPFSFDNNKYKMNNTFIEEFLPRFKEVSKDIISYGFNVLIYTVQYEKSFELFFLPNNKNYLTLQEVPLFELPYIINQSKAVLTHEYTDSFWISLALHKPMIVIKDQNTVQQVPAYNYLKYCKHTDNDMRVKVANKICEIL